MVMLIAMGVATVLFLCCRRRLLFAYVIGAVSLAAILIFPDPVRTKMYLLQRQLMVQIYKAKYVGKQLTYARAELGVPVEEINGEEGAVWIYEYLKVVSRNGATVTDLQLPDVPTGAYR
jgi:hypothetical protein